MKKNSNGFSQQTTENNLINIQTNQQFELDCVFRYVLFSGQDKTSRTDPIDQ